MLYRLAYPCRLVEMKRVFGREETQLSRVFNALAKLLSAKFTPLLEATLQLWVPDFERFATAIRTHIDTPMAQQYVIGFVDGTVPVRKNCRPHGHDDMQRELSSGHRRKHGLKYQVVMLPNGLLADVHGPFPGRRHDAFLLRESALNARLAAAQAGAAAQCKVYGDAAYPILSHISRGFRGANLTPQQSADNTAMSKARICVDWGFGKVLAHLCMCTCAC